jgi:hypothetical protein
VAQGAPTELALATRENATPGVLPLVWDFATRIDGKLAFARYPAIISL